jgi:Concanavalin A-like lectin/glucanases superfamily
MFLGGSERFDRYMNGSVNFTSGKLDMPNTAGAYTPIAGLVSSASCTVCGWGYHNSTASGVLWCIGGDSVGGLVDSFFALAYNLNGTNNFEFWQDDIVSSNLIAGASILDVWRFYAMTSNSAGMVGYTMTTKGVLTTVSAAQSTHVGSNVQFNISSSDEGDPEWPGYIAGVKVWNRALSAVELRAESNQLAPVNARGLVSYMPLRNPGNAKTDSFQQGRVWVKTGTLLLGPAPPVPEVAVPKRFWYGSTLLSQSIVRPTDTLFYGMT